MTKEITIATSLLFLVVIGVIVALFVKSINKNDGKVKKVAPKMVVAISVFAVLIVLLAIVIIAMTVGK